MNEQRVILGLGDAGLARLHATLFGICLRDNISHVQKVPKEWIHVWYEGEGRFDFVVAAPLPTVVKETPKTDTFHMRKARRTPVEVKTVTAKQKNRRVVTCQPTTKKTKKK